MTSFGHLLVFFRALSIAYVYGLFRFFSSLWNAVIIFCASRFQVANSLFHICTTAYSRNYIDPVTNLHDEVRFAFSTSFIRTLHSVNTESVVNATGSFSFQTNGTKIRKQTELWLNKISTETTDVSESSDSMRGRSHFHMSHSPGERSHFSSTFRGSRWRDEPVWGCFTI